MGAKRRDIQGLRALAVGLVVIFHLWPGRLSGGYVGVDVFFVISGYLITSHLITEVDRSGTLSVTRFWVRRIRRLLPAAFIALGGSIALALAFMPKALLQQNLFEIAASALYAQNWVLAGNSVDYLAANNQPSLVQHYWSLSVEEQFYAIWPLLILGAIWIAARLYRRDSARSHRQAIAVALAVVLVASLAYSVFETLRSQPSAYFTTPTRAWEFAAGGLLVFLPRRITGQFWLRHRLTQTVLSWTGVAMIAISAITLNADTAFPGYIALLPVAGAALFLYSGESESRWSPAYVSGFGPIQFVGDISYAVYLWHWPLIVVFPFVFGHDLTFRGRLLILAATLALAVVTKFLVEDPVRNATGWRRRRRAGFAFMAAGMAILVTISGCTSYQIDQSQQKLAAQMAAAVATGEGCFGAAAMVANNHCARPYAVTATTDVAYAAKDSYWTLGAAAKDYGVGPNDPCPVVKNGHPQDCVFGDTNTPAVTIALVGDSHAVDLLDPLLTYAKAHNWRIELFALAGCNGFEGLPDAPPSPYTAEKAESCRSWATSTESRLVNDEGIDLVLFSNLSNGYTVPPSQVVDYWNQLKNSGKTVVVMRDVPGMPGEETPGSQSGPECVELSKQSYDPCAWTPPEREDFMSKAIQLDAGAVPVVDLSPYLCQSGKCHTVIGGVVVYFDDNHLTFSFAQSLAPFLGAQLQAIVARR